MNKPIAGCPQPDAPTGHAVQFPLTLLAYWGPCRQATSCIWRDAAGLYWVEPSRDLTTTAPVCGLRRFSSINAAYDFGESHA